MSASGIIAYLGRRSPDWSAGGHRVRFHSLAAVHTTHSESHRTAGSDYLVYELHITRTCAASASLRRRSRGSTARSLPRANPGMSVPTHSMMRPYCRQRSCFCKRMQICTRHRCVCESGGADEVQGQGGSHSGIYVGTLIDGRARRRERRTAFPVLTVWAPQDFSESYGEKFGPPSALRTWRHGAASIPSACVLHTERYGE